MAQVTIRGSTLQVYSEPDTSPKYIIGSLSNGEFIDVLSTRIVLSTQWARFTSTNYKNAWAIVQSPSVNYKYIDLSKNAPPAMSILPTNNGQSGIGQTSVNVKNVEDIVAKERSGRITDTSVRVPIGSGVSSGSVYTANIPLGNLDDGSRKSYYTGSLSSNPPGIVQNNRGYPFIKGVLNGRYMYDYATDYSNPTLVKALDLVRDSVNFSLSNPKTIFKWNAENYNRFKVVNPNDLLAKAFPHIFFIRPDCELVAFTGSSNPGLGYNVRNIPLYNLYFKNCPEVVYSLVKNYGSNHNFLMLLSNRAESLDLRDRALEADTYGKSFRGNSIAYGKHMEKGSAAGEFSVQYTDDYDLHILKVHELWLDYISGIKTGRYTPTESNIINKVIDYASSVFYVLCGPDGETIVYIAKYTGVFPTTIPDSALQFSKGNIISNPDFSINYQYSWVEHNVPELIYDFNQMASPADFTAESTYQPDILSTGTTWVGAPYIQLENQLDGTSKYKLRFRHLARRGR